MAQLVSARVPLNVAVNWRILALAMRVENEELLPKLQEIIDTLSTIRSDLPELIQTAEEIHDKMRPLLEEVECLKAESLPLWTDDYNLCGDPECFGDCRVCQEGEYDGEEEYTEKYCRRGRR